MLKRMDCHGVTRRGKLRTRNDDQFLIADLNKSMRVHSTSLDIDAQTRLFGGSQGKLLLVADGDQKSSAAVDNIVSYVLNAMHWMLEFDRGPDDELIRNLKSSLRIGPNPYRDDFETLLGRQDVAVAVTMTYLCWPRMFVVHIGDSRCYLFRQGKLERLTVDQVAATESDAAENGEPPTNGNSKSNGESETGDDDRFHGEFLPEAVQIDLKLGDCIVLCTDGFCDAISDDRIRAALVAGDDSAQRTCERLMNLVEKADLDDDATVVIAKFFERASEEFQAEAQAETESIEADEATSKVAISDE